MKKVLFTAMLLAALCGCSRNEAENPTQPGTLAEIQLSAGSVTTKVVVDGDVAIAGLQFLRSDVSGGNPTFADQTAIGGSRAQGTGAITFQTPQKYTAAQRTYFASYYPVATSVANGIATWTIDGKCDIMIAAPIDAGTNSSHASIQPLVYTHELAQVEITCKAALLGNQAQERWGNIQSICFKGASSGMTYSYATLATAASTTLADIAFVAPDYETNFTPQAVPASSNTDVTMAGMFVPVGRTFQLELLTAGPVNGQPITKLLNIDLGEGKTLEKGKKHKITLTFRESPGITDPINITSSVAPWEPGNNAEHELE